VLQLDLEEDNHGSGGALIWFLVDIYSGKCLSIWYP
jgi:hypothetical protein